MQMPPNVEALAAPIEAAAGRRARLGRFALLGAGVAVILYLQLKPSPSAQSIPFLPQAVAALLDADDFLNNVAGFGALAILTHFAFAGFRRELGRRVFVRAAVLAATVVVLEIAQLWLPMRHCDWHDVLAGWAGIALASVPWLRGSRLYPLCD